MAEWVFPGLFPDRPNGVSGNGVHTEEKVETLRFPETASDFIQTVRCNASFYVGVEASCFA